MKKRIHPFWFCWFAAGIALPGTIAYATTANNVYVTAYAAFHGLAVFVGLAVGIVTHEVPLVREVSVKSKRDLELEKLQEENRRLSEALLTGEKDNITAIIKRRDRA